MEKQYGKLILGGAAFELDDCEDTRLYIFESNEYEDTFTVSFDARFKEGIFNGEEISPYISIGEHETHKSDISEIVGDVYSVDSPEEADEREDLLYIYEHEPFVKYSLKILEMSEKMVHISMEGTAITDGYSVPYETADFSGDFWFRSR